MYKKQILKMFLPAILVIAVFALDVATPVGYNAAILYLAPLILFFKFYGGKYYISALCLLSAAIALALILKHAGDPALPHDAAFFNGILIVIAGWITGFVIYGREKARRIFDKERQELKETGQQFNSRLEALNSLALELAALPRDRDLREFVTEKLIELTGAAGAAFSDYDKNSRVLTCSRIGTEPGLRGEFIRLFGKQLLNVRSPVSETNYREIISNVVGTRQSLTETSYGAIPPLLAGAVQKFLGIGYFIGIAYITGGELYGASVLGIRSGREGPPFELLRSFANMAAVALRRRQAEEDLRASEKRLNRAQEIAHLGSWELDLANNRLTWSDEVYRIFGLGVREFGASYEAFLAAVHPEDRSAVDEAYSSSLREGKDTYEIEHRIVRKSTGEIRYVHEKCGHTRDGSGRIVLSTGMVHDVTERKKAEEVLRRDKATLEKLVLEGAEELLKSYKEIEKLKRLSDIGELAATVAHELRNPLTAINLASHNLQKKTDNPELGRHFSTIAKKVKESNDIINNLLSFSNIKIPNYEAPDVFNLLEEVVENARENYAEQGINVKSLNDSLKNVKIEADPLQLKGLFTNILNNACEACLGVEGRGNIEVEGKTENGELKVRFKDDGPGIEEENLGRVFDPFFSTKAKGTGLGLAVCRQITRLHNGKITIESEKGRGTDVSVILPLKKT